MKPTEICTAIACLKHGIAPKGIKSIAIIEAVKNLKSPSLSDYYKTVATYEYLEQKEWRAESITLEEYTDYDNSFDFALEQTGRALARYFAAVTPVLWGHKAVEQLTQNLSTISEGIFNMYLETQISPEELEATNRVVWASDELRRLITLAKSQPSLIDASDHRALALVNEEVEKACAYFEKNR